MKKKLWSLFLCLVLVCSSFTGCGKDDTTTITEDEDNDKKTNDKSDDKEDDSKNEGKNNSKDDKDDKKDEPDPTPTEEPVKDIFAEKVQEFADAVTEVLEKAEANQGDANKGVAAEYSLELELGDAVAEAYGLSELEKIGLDFTMNMKGTEIAMVAGLLLNGESVLDMDIYENSEAIYVNLPKYSDSYMKMDLQELLGDQMDAMISSFDQMDEMLANMPTAGDYKKMWVDFTEQYMDAMEFQGVEKEQTVAQGDYTVTGDKYTNKMNVEKLESAMNTLTEALAQFEALQLEVTEMELDDATEAYVHYYEGANDTFAIELEVVDQKESIVVMNAEKGYCMYTVADDEAEVLLYTVRESDKKGSIVFIDEIGTENAIAYDNFSENGVDLTMSVEGGNTIELSCQTSGDKTEVEFAMPETGVELEAEFKGDVKKGEMVLSFAYQGIEFGTLSVDYMEVEYMDTPAPAKAVDQETWAAGLDVEAFATDLQQLMTDYPTIANLIMASMGGDINGDDDGNLGGEDDNLGGEDAGNAGGEGTAFVMPEGYTDEFMNMTGYTVDEDGYVDFEPVLDEVIAAGKPSTGMDTMPVTDDQKTQMHEYAKTAYAKYYLADYVFYSIYGSVKYESVNSYYNESYTYYDDSEFSNSIEFTFDAISGELGGITVRNVDKAETVRMANEMFAIAGIDHTVTEENMEEYITVGDISISGYEGSSSYTVYMNIYHY